MEERKERKEHITITRPVSSDPHALVTTTTLTTSPNYDGNDANNAHSSSILSEKQRRALKKKKRKKLKSIGRKHPEFELTYDMMLGIRYAVSLSEPSATTTRTHTHTHTHTHTQTNTNTTTTTTHLTNSHTRPSKAEVMYGVRQRTQTETETQTQTQTQSLDKPPVLSETQSTKLSTVLNPSSSSVFGVTRNASHSQQSSMSQYPSSESDDSDSDDDANQLESEFLETKKYRFPAQGSETTPAHQMSDFKFKDYCPQIFRQLREWFRISTQEYLLTICGDFKLLEFISNSKSGQFFFFSHNSQFIIKTMTRTESIFLRKILPAYYTYVSQQPDTLLPKFYGMHRVKSSKQKIYFLIQQNVFFCDVDDIHEQYDLKGSTQGRRTTKDERKRGAILKDLDWTDAGKNIKIGPQRAKLFKDQLKRDTQWLRTQKIMDYSLLVGIHYRDRARLLSSDDNDAADEQAEPATAAAAGVQMFDVEHERRFEPELQTVAEDEHEEHDNDNDNDDDDDIDDDDHDREEEEMDIEMASIFNTLSNLNVVSDGNLCITPFHPQSSLDNVVDGEQEECKYPPASTTSPLVMSVPRNTPVNAVHAHAHDKVTIVTPDTSSQRLQDAEEEDPEQDEQQQQVAVEEKATHGLNFMIKPSTTEYTYSGGYDSDLDGDKVRSQSAADHEHESSNIAPNRRSSAPALVASPHSAPANKSNIFTFDTPSSYAHRPERHLQSQSLRSDEFGRVLHDFHHPDDATSLSKNKKVPVLKTPSSEQMYPLKSHRTISKKLTLSSSSAANSPMYRGHISVKNPKRYKRKTALEMQFAPEAIALPICIADTNKHLHHHCENAHAHTHTLEQTNANSVDVTSTSAKLEVIASAMTTSECSDNDPTAVDAKYDDDAQPSSPAPAAVAAAACATDTAPAVVVMKPMTSTQSLLSELASHSQTVPHDPVADEETETETETDAAADSSNNDICPWTTYHGGMVYEDDNGEVDNEVYFVGLIDILQKYNKRKKLENWIKKMKYDRNTISAAPPDLYAQRMCDFFEDRVV